MAVGTITELGIDPGGIQQPILAGVLKITATTVVGSASYTTGGDALTPADLGLTSVLHAITLITASSGSNCSAVGGWYDIANQKLMCFSAADSTGAPVSQTGSTTNVSGLTFTITAFGT